MSNELYIATDYHYMKQLCGKDHMQVHLEFWKSWTEPDEFEYSHIHKGTDKRIERRQGVESEKKRDYCKLTTMNKEKMTRNQRKRWRQRVAKRYKECLK